jgi:hypothetical protein
MNEPGKRSDRTKDVLGLAVIASVILLLWTVTRQQVQTRAAVDRLAEAVEEASLRASAAAASPGPERQVATRGSLTAVELREILREELASLRPDRAAIASADAPPRAAPPPENTHAFATASGLVEQALSAGVWTEKDAAALRHIRPALTSEQMVSLSKQLIPAINKQQVRVEGNGPLF